MALQFELRHAVFDFRYFHIPYSAYVVIGAVNHMCMQREVTYKEYAIYAVKEDNEK